MRFFFSQENDIEAKKRDAICERMDAFWQELALEENRLTEKPPRLLAERVGKLLTTIDERLFVEVLPDENGARDVIVSPRQHRFLRPMLSTLLKRAPKLSGLRFCNHQPALTLEEALQRTHQESQLDFSAARVRVGFGRGHLLDVTFFVPGVASAHDEQGLWAAELCAEALIGEELFDRWIGTVRAEPGRRSSLSIVSDSAPKTLPISDFKETVYAAIRGLRQGLPELPWGEGQTSAGWTMLEAEPAIATDYARQDDVAVASTVYPEMLKCYLEGAPFSSERFSRHRERFCYLKIDRGGPSEERLAYREQLEHALGQALASVGGAVVGNGLGLRYLYVDLALPKAHDALERLAKVESSVELGQRCWLLFCDSELADEWVGLGKTVVAPPR